MPNILILEDEKIYAQEITRMVLDVFPSANLMIYPCVPSTLPIIPDLAILDIELEGSKDGIQFMHEYGKQIPAILFYSVCFTRIKESFGINVLGFVEKGEDDSVLKEKLLQAKQILVESLLSGFKIKIRDRFLYEQTCFVHVTAWIA